MTGGVAPCGPQDVADTFRLGRARGPLQRVDGGWSNVMWRLATDRGDVAVKQFAGSVLAADIEAAARVEMAACRAGIPLAAPILARDGSITARIGDDGAVVRAHAWLAGSRLPGGVATSRAIAIQVGEIMSQLHGLSLEGAPQHPPYLHDAGVWRDLLDASQSVDAPWVQALHRASPILMEISADVSRGAQGNGELVVSHREINQTNALMVPPRGLTLIDWDVAGMTDRVREVGSVALEWAGAGRGEPDAEIMAAIVTAYCRDRGALPIDAHFFDGWLAGAVAWLATCVRRALDPRVDDRLRDGAVFHIRESVEKIPRAAGARQQWVRSLQHALGRG